MSQPLKDLLRTSDLSKSDIELVLKTASKFAKEPLKAKKALARKTVAIYMTKSSTRTRLASETAVAHLGGSQYFFVLMICKLAAVKRFQIQPKLSQDFVVR